MNILTKKNKNVSKEIFSLGIGSSFIEENLSKFEEKYPDEFVAVRERNFIAHNENLISLMKVLKERKIDASNVIIEFIPFKNEIVLF